MPQPPQPHPWSERADWAAQEVEATLHSLPDDLQAHARQVPVLFERVPSQDLIDAGFDPDLLGLFDGDPLGTGHQDLAVRPTRILLFLENLWDFAEADRETFLEEVHITYLHELGHYLGLDEDELDERGLL